MDNDLQHLATMREVSKYFDLFHTAIVINTLSLINPFMISWFINRLFWFIDKSPEPGAYELKSDFAKPGTS